MRALAVSLAALLALSCTPPPPKTAERVYPGVIRAPSVYAGDFLLRQHVTATYQDRTVAFDAVLQKRGDELTFLGLTPFGSRAFLLRQTGDEVTFERYVAREMPFPPRYILLDIHRSMFAGLSEDGAILPDGEHTITRGEEIIRERWAKGRLVERSFRRTSGDPPGEITVLYEGGMIPGRVAPKSIGFLNRWFGYRLDIAISSYERL